jgi:ribosome-binding protein aMBF1 (putative translation factor)
MGKIVIDSINYFDVGQRIRDRRKEMNLSGEELAELIESDASYDSSHNDS